MTLTADVLRPHQAEIIQAAAQSLGTREDERYLLICGGRGTLKTSTLTRFLGIQLALLTSAYRGYTMLIAAMTHAQLRDVFLTAWTDQVDPAILPWSYNSATATIHLPNEGRLIMRHAGSTSEGRLSSEKAARLLKGINAHGFYAPEALALAEVFYSATQLAVRAVPVEWRPGMPPYRINWLDANPGGPDHWIYRRFVDTSAREYRGNSISRSYPTTPATSLYTAERIARERAGMPDFVAARDLDAKWAGAMGSLYRLYAGVQVTDDPIPPGGRWSLSFDWGYEVDPCVCLVIYSHGNHAQVMGEIVQHRRLHHQLEPLVKAELAYCGAQRVDYLTGDTGGIDGGGFNALRWWRAHIGGEIRPTDKSRYAGWLRLIKVLQPFRAGDRPELTIHPRCEKTIAALRTLTWNPRGTDSNPSADDDPADALRYWCMSPASPFQD